MLGTSGKLKTEEITSGNGSNRGGSSLDSRNWVHHDEDADVVCWMVFFEVDGMEDGKEKRGEVKEKKY